MAVQDLNIVSPPPKNLCRRLYEPLAFLCCLISILTEDNCTKTPNLESIADKGPKEAFSSFVDKLAQVCDNKHGGTTVTAFSVLQPGCIEYRFASNLRDSQTLATVRCYVKDILETLGNAPDLTFKDASLRSALYSEVLGKVLAFQRPRIQVYLRALVRHFDFCIARCKTNGTPDGVSIAKDLQIFQLLTLRAKACPEEKEFVENTRHLLDAIGKCYQEDLFKEFMRDRTREDREEINRTPWTDLYHALGRLHSYSITVKVFLSTRMRWPELFEAFEVTYVPSSKSSYGRPSAIMQSADGMVNRLTNDREVLSAYPNILEAYHSHTTANQLNIVKLDDEIKRKTHPKQFTPTVHAEVNLADDILREERVTGRVRFFNEGVVGRYIGASKATCRLCDLYFHAPSGPNFEVRKSHRNLYYAWGYPDVYLDDGPGAEQTRKATFESMITAIKHQAAKTIVDRFSVVKIHDSNTTTTDPFRTQYGLGSFRGEDDLTAVPDVGGGSGLRRGHVTPAMMDDLVSTFGQVNLDFDDGTGVTSGSLDSESEDEGGDGGARL